MHNTSSSLSRKTTPSTPPPLEEHKPKKYQDIPPKKPGAHFLNIYKDEKLLDEMRLALPLFKGNATRQILMERNIENLEVLVTREKGRQRKFKTRNAITREIHKSYKQLLGSKSLDRDADVIRNIANKLLKRTAKDMQAVSASDLTSPVARIKRKSNDPSEYSQS